MQAIGSGKVRYWAQALGAELVCVDGQLQPIRGVGLGMGLYRLAVRPVRAALNLLVRLFFLGGARVAFSATNLVMVLRKP